MSGFRRPGLVALLLLAGTTARGEVQTRKIEYTHDGVRLAGHLAWDDAATERRPGVLVVHEWWGLDDYARKRAEQLAAMGYVAFALDMYGTGKLTEHPREAGEWANKIRENVAAWQARADAGLDVLRQQKQVDPGRLAAIGYCFGGATVCQLAYAGTDLRGVASFHGSLPVASDEQAAQIKAPILVCHGAADGFVPAERIAQFREALEGASADYQMVYYSGARHSFTNPGADDRGIDGLKYNRSADRRSWGHLRLFLEEVFSDGKEN